MPKKPLLLPGAKSAILVGTPPTPLSPWWRKAVLILGLVAVLIGAADVVTRFANNVFGEGVGFAAFAPAILLVDPALESLVQGTTTVSAFVPARVVVASIGVDAAVEQVGKTAGGAMATPQALANLAWYKLGAKPGAEGSAVFAGHVNNALGLPGVFKNLSKVKKGDEVKVVGGAGETLVYRVESATVYKEDEAPLAEIFKNTGHPQVVLITCEGDWDEATRTFDKRLVVVARLI